MCCSWPAAIKYFHTWMSSTRTSSINLNFSTLLNYNQSLYKNMEKQMLHIYIWGLHTYMHHINRTLTFYEVEIKWTITDGDCLHWFQINSVHFMQLYLFIDITLRDPLSRENQHTHTSLSHSNTSVALSFTCTHTQTHISTFRSMFSFFGKL